MLGDALQPPSTALVDDALKALIGMGALERTGGDANPLLPGADLDRQEVLTPLGQVGSSASHHVPAIAG